ncbi:hypothetical protein D3C72_909780 [compost metagenome]
MIAHDRTVEQRVIRALGGDVEVSGGVGRFEIDGEQLAGLGVESVLRRLVALDRLFALNTVGAGWEIDRFDAHSASICCEDRQRNQCGQRGGNPGFHLQLHCISMYAA